MNLRTAFVTILALALVAWFLRHANIADVWLQVRQARLDLLFLGFVFVMATYWPGRSAGSTSWNRSARRGSGAFFTRP
jgi:hypothetical protein